MDADFENCEFSVDESARCITARFDLVNHSGEPWTHAAGFAIGYQIYDPETAMFIYEGEWTSPDKDIAPAESAHITIDVQLPPEKGRYHVYLSARTESRGWFYEK